MGSLLQLRDHPTILYQQLSPLKGFLPQAWVSLKPLGAGWILPAGKGCCVGQVHSKHIRALCAECAGQMYIKCFLELFEWKADRCTSKLPFQWFSWLITSVFIALHFVVVCFISFVMPPSSLGMELNDLSLSFLPSSTTVL